MKNDQNQVPLRVPFDYVVNSGAIAANGISAPVLNIEQDADFEVVFIVATATSPLVTVQMFDNATGRRLMNGAVNLANFAGTAQLPFPLVEPYVFARSSTIGFIFTDISGNPNAVQLVLRGYKLYPTQNIGQGSSGPLVPAG